MSQVRLLLLLLLGLVSACWGSNWYIVEGTVVEVLDERRIMVDHDEIKGFMDAMTMPFEVSDPALLTKVKAGDRIIGRLVIEESGAVLTRVRVVGSTTILVQEAAVPSIASIQPGQQHPAFKVQGAAGKTVQIGEGQSGPVALTYIYTTCPMAEFCPAIVGRLKELQTHLADSDARIVAVTIDPAIDTAEVLNAYGESMGLTPERWTLARAADGDLQTMAKLAGMRMGRDEGQLVHSKRLMVLGATGKLIERYDDTNWPMERVAQQLKTGKPPAQPGVQGTITPKN